jgi:hypothetical protein
MEFGMLRKLFLENMGGFILDKYSGEEINV